ncbi:transposase [Pleomorphomonas diazotrophica]|uniref:Transposase n=1 Tax=Pleomorphomonas diazotrophica TaxID=1166257 RepID=A0A1I4UG44_9HYPH|nr:aminoglycoside phosphotransferase family protein [Pleomorphomonas diazotrophica]PKR89210.1 transposase [Pleomorphomonas diazotrophica]SFM87977.1 Ser/Thr protein kinase RdoA involved in Cpx stress response, MazF antagonist [Pleomorphomonas diazotrophica]
MELLEGGRGGICRDGDTVTRPAGPWTPTVHRFLRHLRDRGFTGAPIPIAITEPGQEVVSFVEGRVSEDLSDPLVGSEDMLRSAGELLRDFHAASRGFLEADRQVQTFMLDPREPCEIVCHGDFAPYNVAGDGGRAVGLIDFDTIHPAPALWDLAYAVYRWAPLFSPGHQGGVFDEDTQLRRARIFCDAYGATSEQRRQLPDMIAERLGALVAFMRGRAEAGDEAFVEDVEAGEAALYLADIAYIERIGGRLRQMLR